MTQPGVPVDRMEAYTAFMVPVINRLAFGETLPGDALDESPTAHCPLRVSKPLSWEGLATERRTG